MGKLAIILPYPDMVAYGVRMLSACLKAAGHQCELLFIRKPIGQTVTPDELEVIRGFLREHRPDVVGFSTVTSFMPNTNLIAREVRALGLPVIYGGIHATLDPEDCRQYADAVFVGEAERELPRWLGGERQPGIIRCPTVDVNTLPLPDYSFDHEYYLDGVIRRADLASYQRLVGNIYCTFTTRGCQFNCAYCSNNALKKIYDNRNCVRTRKMSDVIDELRLMNERFQHPKIFNIWDDSFMGRPLADITLFAEYYRREIRRPLNVIGLIPEYLDESKFKLLVDCGMFQTRLGIQSGSPKTLRLFHRGRLATIEKAIGIINRQRRRVRFVQYDLILDNPFETDAEIRETLQLGARTPKPYQWCLYSLAFYPYTELYDRAKLAGLLHDVYNKNYRACVDRESELLLLLFQYFPTTTRINQWLIERYFRKPKDLLWHLLRIGLPLVRAIKVFREKVEWKFYEKLGN